MTDQDIYMARLATTSARIVADVENGRQPSKMDMERAERYAGLVRGRWARIYD